MNRYFLFLTSYFLFTLAALAQVNIPAVLASIEQHNPRLKALRGDQAATLAELRSGNALGETSVEYSPSWMSGEPGMSMSELIVSQSFDFPTLYSARSKQANLKQEALSYEYQQALREVLREAAGLCYELNGTYELRDLLTLRKQTVDSMLIICEKRLKHGYATLMEHNQLRLDLMDLQTEIAENEGNISRLRLALQGMGAPELLGKPGPKGYSQELPALGGGESASAAGGSMSGSASLNSARANLRTAEQEVAVQKQGWLPQLTVGYRRNFEGTPFVHHGVIVGVSLPLFSNAKKVKAAKLRREAAEQEVEATRREVESRHKQLQSEAIQLERVLATYDVDLMQQSLADLHRAVEAGELSITDYYPLVLRIYTTLQQRITTNVNYQKIKAELHFLGL